MNYILRITTRYCSSEDDAVRKWVFKTYNESLKKMIEELESLHRQCMASELTNVIGYIIVLNEWVTGNTSNNVAYINYDLAL